MIDNTGKFQKDLGTQSKSKKQTKGYIKCFNNILKLKVNKVAAKISHGNLLKCLN